MRNYPILRSQGQIRVSTRRGEETLRQVSLALGKGLFKALQTEAEAANSATAELLRGIMSDFLREPWAIDAQDKDVMRRAIAEKDAFPLRVEKSDWAAFKRLAIDRDISASELLREVLWSWFRLGLPIEKRGQRLDDAAAFEIQSKRLAFGILQDFRRFEFENEAEARAALEKLKADEEQALGACEDFDQVLIWFLQTKEDGTRLALEGVDLRRG